MAFTDSKLGYTQEYTKREKGKVVTDSRPQLDNSMYWSGLIEVPTFDWIYTMDQLRNETPSRKDPDIYKRLKYSEEMQKRAKGIVYLFNCCRQLRLSRSVALTAATLFHRFYMRKNMMSFHYYEIAATSLFVGCKVEECRRKLNDIVKICAKIALQGKMNEQIDEDSKIYWKWKDLITKYEEILFDVLCFDLTPENPYRVCLALLKLDNESSLNTPPNESWVKNSKILFGQCADYFELIFRTPISVVHRTNAICALVLMLASNKMGITFPVGFIKTGFEVSLEEVCNSYDHLIEFGKQLEPLDKYFQILRHLPQMDHTRIEEILNGIDDSSLYISKKEV